MWVIYFKFFPNNMGKNQEGEFNMKGSILQAEVVKMQSFDNLFIEMTAKSCNQRCKNCYIDLPQYTKKTEDFISIQTIENAFKDIQDENIKCIYLSGAEPMTHPDFNSILRFCLKKNNVCICTNGSFINEKKARFLKKVSEETENELIFKISIDHYDEIKNDDIRYRGAYRHGIFAVKSLIKYNFMPIITVTNFYGENEKSLFEGFKQVFNKFGYELDKSHLIINPPYYKNNHDENNLEYKNQKTDCTNCRVLSKNGIYNCPFLTDDFRGRCGSSFNDYNKKCVLETEYCATCLKTQKPIFCIDFSSFE